MNRRLFIGRGFAALLAARAADLIFPHKIEVPDQDKAPENVPVGPEYHPGPGWWTPTGPLSSMDCPQGIVCVNGKCVPIQRSPGTRCGENNECLPIKST